ncbi:MAG TPA: hypothetical protein VLK23_18405 [Thermodesulfobacteriota bacterium]|nr:hypothetical protein [Thermodesulfobacteriota bacterium]
MGKEKKESGRNAEADEKGIDAAINHSKWNLRDDHAGHDDEGEGKRKKT